MLGKRNEYFLTLAECLSFTQTASIHGISQTAVSSSIATLEEQLGVLLFKRDRRNVVLTEAGRYYERQIRDILRRYDDTVAQLRVIADGYHGHLKVGVGMYEYCSTEGFFSGFLNMHPEVKVDILQYPYSTLTEKLRTGELDVIIADAICESAFSHHELCTRTLFTSQNDIVADAAVAAGFSSAADLLRTHRLITNCESDGPSSISMIKQLLMDQFGFVPETIEQTNTVNSQLMMVRARHGVAIVPRFVTQAQGADLVCFELPEKRILRYNLISLANHSNTAIDLIFSFEESNS